MTWNELAALIEKMPADVRNATACVWTPEDLVPSGEFSPIASVAGFDAELPISMDNLPSVSVVEG